MAMMKSSTSSEIPRTYDGIFDQASTVVPVQFLRVIAWRESRLNPGDITMSHANGKVYTKEEFQKASQKLKDTQGAHGLFQTMKEDLGDYNRRHGTNYTLRELSDVGTKESATRAAQLGTAIGVEHIENIVKAYAKNHPNTLYPDWGSERYVSLLVQGFNSGWNSLQTVVGSLEKLGIAKERITPEAVSEAAPKMVGPHLAARHAALLSNPEKVRYAKSVAAQYMHELGPQGPGQKPEQKAEGRRQTEKPGAAATPASPVPSAPSVIAPTFIVTPPAEPAQSESVTPSVLHFESWTLVLAASLVVGAGALYFLSRRK